MREAKHVRTGKIWGGLWDCDSLSWAVRLDSAKRGTAQQLHVLASVPSFGSRAPSQAARSPAALFSSPPSSQCHQLSTHELQNRSVRSILWKIPSTPAVQTWEGEGRAGKNVVDFKRDFYCSSSKPLESCVKPEHGEVQDTWK